MNYKEELKKLIDIAKTSGKISGEKLTRKEIADRLGYAPTYLSQLIGDNGRVDETHILLFKDRFAKELQAAGIPLAGDPLNEERAMILALLSDYIEQTAIREKVDSDVVEDRLKKKASLILKGLNARR